MPRKRPRPAAIAPAVIPITSARPPDAPGWGRCDACGVRLELYQPDIERPERLLGFCEGCRGWWLILVGAGDAGAMKVVLPEGERFRAAWESRSGSD